jgi:hypothetical protein
MATPLDDLLVGLSSGKSTSRPASSGDGLAEASRLPPAPSPAIIASRWPRPGRGLERSRDFIPSAFDALAEEADTLDSGFLRLPPRPAEARPACWKGGP